MHFSIPETESRSGDSGGSAYVLRKEYGANVLPAFPPKKLFSLTPAEVEQRREQLEKYMQAVRQDPLL
uniref:Sorting nexin 17 n=5 Tax=Eutheria TaxID=9347 RepID=A0A286XQB5_CAVPO